MKFTLVLVRCLLRRSSGHDWAYEWHFLDSQPLQIVLTKGIAHLQLPTLNHHPPYPLSPAHLLINSTCDITVAGLLIIHQCQLTNRNSYSYSQEYFIYTVNLVQLQSSTRNPQQFYYLKLVFLEIPNVIIWSIFQNQVTYDYIIPFLRFIMIKHH